MSTNNSNIKVEDQTMKLNISSIIYSTQKYPVICTVTQLNS